MKKVHLMILAMAAMMLCPMSGMAQKKQKKQTVQTEQKDTVAILTERAQKGDDKAQNTLGNWYYTGKFVKQDYETALKYWALSAKQNNAEAIGNMAMCYQLGRGTKTDSTMAVKLYEKAITSGNKAVLQQHVDLADKKNNLFSNVFLHHIYQNGIGVARDQAKAQQYLKKAAEGGDVNCMRQQAILSLNNKDTKESAKWFKKLADKNDPTGIYYYGYQLYKGMGVTQDKEKGVEYLKRSARQHNPNAHRLLGKAYYEGDGVEQDYTEAVSHLKVAASAKLGESQMLLAKCYMNGQGIAQDYDQAAQWLAEAYCQNSKLAEQVEQFVSDETDETFKNYVEGLKEYYVDKDYEDAIKLFKKVDKAKNVEGITMQGVCLADTENAKHNDKKAFKTLTAAAESSAAAKYYLAQLYQEGRGTEKDVKKAADLIVKAADGDNGYAQALAGDMYFEGKNVTQDYVKAAEYYLKAEAQSKLNAQSAKNLAKCYQMSISSLPDLKKSDERIEALGKVRTENHLLDMLKKL